MAFREKTIQRMRERVESLSRNFAHYAQEFENLKLFAGPSLYFHRKTVGILRSHACSVRKCLEDPAFLDSLYATLTSWGLHRMGKRGAKLVELPEMVWSLRRRAEDLARFEGLRLWELDQPTMERVRERLWNVVSDLEISATSIKIVAGSKALHHFPVLPGEQERHPRSGGRGVRGDVPGVLADRCGVC